MESLNLNWKSTGDLLRWAAKNYSDNKFIIFENQSVTFSQADQFADQIAIGLTEKGLAKGDRVAVMLPNGLLFPILWLAIGRAGLVMTPINTEYKSHDLAYVLNDSGASLLVLHNKFLGEFKKVADDCASLKNVIQIGDKNLTSANLERNFGANAGSFAAPELDDSDLVNIQYTSGTTGFPKGCMLSHRYWLLMGHFANAGLRTTPTDVHLNVQPFYYMDGQWNTMLSLMAGVPLVLTSRFSVSSFWKTVHDYNVTYFYCIGTMPTMLLNREPDSLEKSHRVRAVSCSGIPKDLHARIEERFGCPWREGYGSTESGTDLMVPFEQTDCVGTGMLGKPIVTKEMRIIDPEGNDADTGELVVTGEPMMLGYWNNPEATAENIRSGSYYTGDLFKRDEDGNYYIIGRVKDMVRRGGENISSAEVESVLTESPLVSLAAVIPVPDPIRGEEAKALIILSNNAAPTKETAQEILSFTGQKLAAFKVPRFIQFTKEFSMTASERVEKHKLIELSDQQHRSAYDATLNDWAAGELPRR